MRKYIDDEFTVRDLIDLFSNYAYLFHIDINLPLQDYVTVYDGYTTREPVILKFCGGGEPVPEAISSGPEILVEFTTSPYGTFLHPTPPHSLHGFQLEVQVRERALAVNCIMTTLINVYSVRSFLITHKIEHFRCIDTGNILRERILWQINLILRRLSFILLMQRTAVVEENYYAYRNKS